MTKTAEKQRINGGYSELPHVVVELLRQKYITQRQFMIYVEYLDRFNNEKQRAFASAKQIAKEMQVSNANISADRTFLRTIGLIEFENETWRTPKVTPNTDPNFDEVVSKVNSARLGGLIPLNEGGSFNQINKQEDSNKQITKQEDSINIYETLEKSVVPAVSLSVVQTDSRVNSTGLTYKRTGNQTVDRALTKIENGMPLDTALRMYYTYANEIREAMKG